MADTGQMNITFGVNGGDSVTREAKRIEQSLNKLVGKIEHQAKTLSMTAREMDLYKAHTMQASAATLGHINSLHDSIEAQKSQAQAIQDSITKTDAELKAKQAMEAQEQKRADSINSIISELQREQSEMGQSSDEIQIRKAMMEGATDAELNQIRAIQSSIAADKAKVVEDKKSAAATKQAEQANKAKDASIDRIIQSLNDQKAMLGMTSDQIMVYKAEQMGATKAQLDAIKAAQAQVIAQQAVTKSGGGLNNSLRMMRGGFGQVGHQIQDISVQMQMGTNGMIVFGQQGSQIASLFGSGGAIIGAFLAVGAAIYTYVNQASVDAAKKLNDFEKELAKTATTADKFDDSLRNVAIVELTKKVELLKNTEEELNEKFRDSKDTIASNNASQDAYKARLSATYGVVQTMATGLGQVMNTMFSFEGSTKEANYTLQQHEELVAKNAEQLSIFEKQLKALITGSDDPYEQLIKKSKEFGSELDNLTLRYGKSEIALLRLKAAEIASADPIILAELNKKIDKYEEQKESSDSLTEAIKRYNEELARTIALGEKSNGSYQDQIDKNEEFVAAIQAKSKATQMDKYETVLQSAEYKKLGATKQLLVRLAIEEWKATDALAKKKADEAAVDKLKADTIKGVLESLKAENKLLEYQIENKYNAAEAQIAYTLSTNGATQATIDQALAVQALIDKNRELAGELNKNGDDSDSGKGGKDRTESDFESMLDGFKAEEDALNYSLNKQLEIAQKYYDLAGSDKKAHAQAMMEIEKGLADNTNEMLMSQFSDLASMFDQTTALGKAFYVVQQGMAAADSVIKGMQQAASIELAYSTLAAKTGNPSLEAVGKAKGQMATAMGYARAGAIMGQTIASFEGGGITFNGVRSGGVDGKGGRMAVVHPNEKITDLEKGGDSGGAVNVSFTINAVDTQGFDQLLQSRRGQIVGMVQKAVNNVGRRIM